MTVYYSVFDADICIKTANPNEYGHSMLSHVLGLFQKSHIHGFVLDEINEESAERKHVDQLVQQSLLEVVTDEMLLDWLSRFFQSEEMACQTFQKMMDDNMNMFASEKIVSGLQNFYKTIQESNYQNVGELLGDLIRVESQRGREDLSLGEYKTAMIVAVFRLIGNTNISVFLSDDKKARAMMLNTTNDGIDTVSFMGTFFYLKQDSSITYVDAEKYLKTSLGKYGLGLGSPITVLDDQNNNTVSKTYGELLKDIYEGKVSLLKNGRLKYEI